MLAERKQPVRMILEVTEKGQETPVTFLWPDGRRFDVEVLGITAAPIELAGSLGQCYLCQLRNSVKQVKVYREQSRWFVISKTVAKGWGEGGQP